MAACSFCPPLCGSGISSVIITVAEVVTGRWHLMAGKDDGWVQCWLVSGSPTASLQVLISSLAGEGLSRCWLFRASQVSCWVPLSQMPQPHRDSPLPSPADSTSTRPPPLHTALRSSCSSLNCLQLGCIPAIMRCLRLNAVGSTGQNSRPEARETDSSKHQDWPSWVQHPPGVPHPVHQPQCQPLPHPRARDSR